MIYIWLGAIVLFLLIETNTVSLVSLWFAAGALAAMIGAMLGAELWLQLVLFFGVASALLACLRPLARKWLKPRIVKTNVDAMIGQQGYVTQDIDNLCAVGQVKLGNMEWSARSTAGVSISAGTLVQVDRIEGVRAFVSVVEKEE